MENVKRRVHVIATSTGVERTVRRQHVHLSARSMVSASRARMALPRVRVRTDSKVMTVAFNTVLTTVTITVLVPTQRVHVMLW